MEPAAHREALEAEGRAFAAAVARAPAAVVPTCPGWDVAALAHHLGGLHRGVAALVTTRSAEAAPLREARAQPPPPAAGLSAWLEEGLAGLLGAFDAASWEDAAVWSWARAPRPVAFWARRMAHETAVHRVDAELAQGATAPLDATLAVDGVEEVLDTFVPLGRVGGELRGGGETLHLHAIDADGEWLLRFNPEGLAWSRGHARGDCAVRAPASDLDLLLWGRRGTAGLELHGDAAVLARWTERVRI